MNNKILRATMSAALAAGVLAAGLNLGLAGQAQAKREPVWPERPLYAPGEMPAFPGAREYSMGEGLALNQTPIRISYFQTDRSPEAVAAYYQSAFGPEAIVRRTGKDISVMSVDIASATTRSVNIRPGKRVTYVFPSVYPVSAAPFRLSPDPDSEIPFDANSVGAVDLTQGTGLGRVVSYQQLDSLDNVEKSYKQAMADRGLKQIDRRSSAGGEILQFEGAGKHAQVTLVPYKQQMPGTGVLVQVGPAAKE